MLHDRNPGTRKCRPDGARGVDGVVDVQGVDSNQSDRLVFQIGRRVPRSDKDGLRSTVPCPSVGPNPSGPALPSHEHRSMKPDSKLYEVVEFRQEQMN